jgi:hypothetical protein
MLITFDDLQMWSVTAQNDAFMIAYQRAKAVFESGNMPIIDWGERYDFTISKGRKLKLDEKLPKFKISHRLATSASRARAAKGKK